MPTYSTNINEIIYEEEALKMYKAAINNYERTFISLLWMTGGRINEILELKKEDISWDENELRIKIKTEKLRKNRFYLNQRILKLERVYGCISTIFLQTIIDMAKRAENGEKIIKRKWQWGNKIITRLGISELKRPICPYTFRHSRFSILAFNGYTAWQIKEIKGSKDLRSVEMYVHAVPELVKFSNMNQSRGEMLKKEMTMNLKAETSKEQHDIKEEEQPKEPASNLEHPPIQQDTNPQEAIPKEPIEQEKATQPVPISGMLEAKKPQSQQSDEQK